MNKLYSKRVLIIKAICAFMLPVLYSVASVAYGGDDDVLFLFVALVMLGLLYTVPFWLTLLVIKKQGSQKKLMLIGLDALSLLLPVVASSIITEVVTMLIEGANIATGIFTVVTSVIFVLLSLIFWGFYAVFGWMYKQKTK